jgi:hypothetical protein|tara:strand:+ start:469 stop:747 length:279 start_codon:yes stop_codon:yes gene_type:complete
MVEEIISHTIDDYRGSIFVELLYSEKDTKKLINLEIFLDDLEEYCELFDNVDWVDYEEDYTSTVTIQKNVDTLELQEGLNRYIEDNPDVLEG